MLLALGAAQRSWGQSEGNSEYQVKAAFLYHFAEFVEWPDSAFKDLQSPIVYCTIGENAAMLDAVQASLRGKAIRSRAVEVRRLREWKATEGCHVLFVGQSEEKRLGTALPALKMTPVLTVGDSEKFVEIGGMIQFCQESNKIRFHINLTPVTTARLKMSSRLLALAKTVIGSAGGN